MIIKKPKIDIDTPDRKFWQRLGLSAARHIRKRTEKDGRDSDGKQFRPYSRGYESYRAKKGRSRTPNLSFTGRMMSALPQGVSATDKGAKIGLYGRQGGKAWYNELSGRKFLAISRKEADRINREVATWTARKNKLK